MSTDSYVVQEASLGLADVLVDDITADGLCLLLPHQQDTLVDEHVLLLQEVTSYRKNVNRRMF